MVRDAGGPYSRFIGGAENIVETQIMRIKTHF